VLLGGEGSDTVVHNMITDGSDRADLGPGMDVVQIASQGRIREVRLTFVSAQVGDGRPTDAGATRPLEDGGLAVRVQGEDLQPDSLVGPISRFDDEGITFVAAAPDVVFEVRDLLSGVSRGNTFKFVQLGTAGDDSLNGQPGPLAVVPSQPVYINGGGGNDRIIGGTGSDVLVGGSGDDLVDAGGGNDTLLLGDGADFAGGQDGDDTLSGGAGVDVLFGDAGNDTLSGEADDDRLFGGDGADTLRGGEGADYLDGNAGDDVLEGGAGADNLRGGAGADRFVFAALADSRVNDRDRVLDFDQAAGDRIDLSAMDADSTQSGDQAFTLVGAFTGQAGQAVLTIQAGGAELSVDVDGDRSADFSVLIFGQVSGDGLIL
jgi:Ca2+-binding RTX toxin-like protein